MYNTKISIPFLALILLVPVGMGDALAQEPGSEDPKQDPISTNEEGQYEELTPEQKEIMLDDIVEDVVNLQIENQRLSESSDDVLTQDEIEENNRLIAELIEDIDELDPPRPLVDIPEELEAEMNHTMLALIASDLPLMKMKIDGYTGKLAIKVDINKNSTSTKADILRFTGDLPVDITYGEDYITFQGSCNTSTGYCNPVVGGSLAKDSYYGQNCTVSIGVVRSTIFGTDHGILIPNHCNPNNHSYYQPNNMQSYHFFGDESVYGGLLCDCRFVVSDSRSVNTYKISLGSSDYTTFGKSDIQRNTLVFTYGAVTQQLDYGRVTAINTIHFIGDDLYEISGLNLQDGDSGAPIISIGNRHYGGMSIGADDDYNYAHDWSFMKSRLQLRD